MNSYYLAFSAVFLGTGALFFACSDDPDRARRRVETEANTTFSYRGEGCSYDVAPPSTRAFRDLRLHTPLPALSTTDTAVRVRLGLGGNTDYGTAGFPDPSKTVAILWETNGNTSNAEVRYGTSPDALNQNAKGYSFTLPPPEFGLGGNDPESYMHEVHLCGLTPGATYYYQVGGGAGEAATQVWSAVQSFTTVPAVLATPADAGATEAGTDDASVDAGIPLAKEIVVGISGDSRDRVATWQIVQQRMKSANVSLQLFSGDLTVAGSSKALTNTWLDAIWKDPNDPSAFLTLGQQVFLPIAGNHEAEAAQFYGNFTLPGTGKYEETYFGIDVGPVHYVLIDDEPQANAEDGEHAATIRTWLDGHLGKIDRKKTPFVVAISHRGIYSTSKHANESDVLGARRAFAPLFEKHKVNVVFNGHDHEFERSKPLKPASDGLGAPTVQPSASEGTTYIVSAGAGADPYAIGTTASTFREKAVQFGNGTPYIGIYSLVTATRNTLTVRSFAIRGLTQQDDLLDTFEVTL
ncbi:MAG: fibronectin type III domain-containing protein [Polyangiaceae bacterium]|nr:fibronectin type III domain-containing protein [Polyangiaceae bacterium]